MPEWTPADNDVLTAAELTTNVAEQVISTVTAGTRPAGTQGQVIFETDTERFQAYDGSGWQQFSQLGAWTTWTPTLTQSGTVTYTVVHSAYSRIGTTIIANCTLTCTSSGSANNAIQVTLPVTAVAAQAGFGTGFVRDTTGTLLAVGIVALNATTTAVLRDAGSATNALVLGQTGTGMPNALAAGDTVHFGMIYEAA